MQSHKTNGKGSWKNVGQGRRSIFFREGPSYRKMKVKEGTLPETNRSPLKNGHAKRKNIFQPSIFKGHVRFREGTT